MDRPRIERDRTIREKTEFVEAVVEFFKGEGIKRLVDNGRQIDLIVLKHLYCSQTDYELFYDIRGLVRKIRREEKVFGPPSDRWYDAIPYDAEFQYHGHFKPTKEEFIEELENKVRWMIR